MRLKKNRPYNHWLKSQGHYLLCFSTSNQSEPIRFVCDMRLRPVTLCFIRFLIEQISVPALNTCVKMLREGDERTKALFLLAMLEMQQSKPMRVNMKEPEELEPMKKIDEIRRFSNKELRLTKESMGALPKSSEYCGPIKKKSYS